MLVLGKGFTIALGNTVATVVGIRSRISFDSIGNRVVSPLVDLEVGGKVHTVEGLELETEIA